MKCILCFNFIYEYNNLTYITQIIKTHKNAKPQLSLNPNNLKILPQNFCGCFRTTAVMSCCVPTCGNEIGAPFPKNSAIKEKWIKALALPYLAYPPGSFVCFDHFKEEDIMETSDGELKVKADAVPNVHLNLGNKGIPKICRVCMSDANLVKIWQPFDESNSIMSVLMLCCYPVKISITDNLPKEICEKCLSDLRSAQKLRQRCLESVKRIQVESEQAVKRKLSVMDDLRQQTKRTCLDAKNDDEESIENIKLELEKDKLLQFNKPIRVDKTESETKVLTDASCKIVGQKIILPKQALEKYASPKGRFPCAFLNEIENVLFIESGGYLYAHGLQKRNLCKILCVSDTCPAFGTLTIVSENCYDEEMELVEPHNHPPPKAGNEKRAMYLYVMRWRVQLDKSLNVMTLYEKFCEKDPSLKTIIPLRSAVKEICRAQTRMSDFKISSFESFYREIDNKSMSKLHYTASGQQFFQEKFSLDDGTLAVVFSNKDTLVKLSDSKVMYVDASFKIDTNEDFKYQLVTVLLWIDDSYYPVLYGFVNRKTRDIFKKIFSHLHDVLAPNLRPNEIVTDYEANLYYALGETYLESHIGGSVFYYTQNLYKKACSLNLNRDLETNSYFKSVYHMLLMLPLLPVNTITDGLNNIEEHARDMGLSDLMKPIFEHVRKEWMENVTPELFCVHCLENRINENVMAPFKKLRDLLLVHKGKFCKPQVTITHVVEKLIELEAFLFEVYTKSNKKSFGRDLSCSQKKNVLRAWHYIESYPKININVFFTKVLGYIKCMENQLWIWGYYRFIGDGDDELISATNFSIVNCITENVENITEEQELEHDGQASVMDDGSMIIMDAVLDENGKVLIQSNGEYLDETGVFHTNPDI